MSLSIYSHRIRLFSRRTNFSFFTHQSNKRCAVLPTEDRLANQLHRSTGILSARLLYVRSVTTLPKQCLDAASMMRNSCGWALVTVRSALLLKLTTHRLKGVLCTLVLHQTQCILRQKNHVVKGKRYIEMWVTQANLVGTVEIEQPMSLQTESTVLRGQCVIY